MALEALRFDRWPREPHCSAVTIVRRILATAARTANGARLATSAVIVFEKDRAQATVAAVLPSASTASAPISATSSAASSEPPPAVPSASSR